MTDAFGQNPALKIQKVACRLITYVYAKNCHTLTFVRIEIVQHKKLT